MEFVAYYWKFRGPTLDYAVKAMRETSSGGTSEITLDVYDNEEEAAQKVRELRAWRDSELSQVYPKHIPS